MSVFGHLGLLALFLGFGARGGQMSGDGVGDVSTMEVSLVGVSEAKTVQVAAAVDPAAELLARLGADTAPTTSPSSATPTPSTQAASLDELLAETSNTVGSRQGDPDATAARARAGVKNALGQDVGEASAGASGAAGGGGLWSVIAPCWKRQHVPRNIHARMVVRLDLLGRLTDPPQVVRTEGMNLDRDQMLAESRAFDALTACLPAARGRFSGSHVLDFRGE